MTYFKELPNLEVVNTTSNQVSIDETLIVKNLFKRAKLRTDIESIITGFEYYTIEENERPDQVAQKIYRDPELDWVILITNNIINVQNDWPISKSSFDNYLIEKYGSEEALQEIHHYETLELKDYFGRVVLPTKLIVDEAFYKAPEYQTPSTPPYGINFPPIYIPGTTSEIESEINENGSVNVVYNLSPGVGYVNPPKISFSDPPITLNASASVEITDYTVTSIVGLNSGQGYNTSPNVVISPPSSTESRKATAECGLGTGPLAGTVESIINLNPGTGYGLTAPSITFESPRSLLNALFLNETFAPVGAIVDGMYVREDGLRLYSSNGTSSNLIREFHLSNSWDSTTLAYYQGLDTTLDFSYCTGIEFKPDGTKMFVCGGKFGIFKVVAYDLSTPWDISTAIKSNQIIKPAPGGIRFDDTGTKFYYLNSNLPNTIQKYTLSTAWDITSIGTMDYDFDVTAPTGDIGITGFTFFSGGKNLFIVGQQNTYIYQFNLSTKFDLRTAVYTDQFFVGDKLTIPTDVFISPSRKTLFVCGGTADKLYEYKIYSVAEAFSRISNGSVSEVVITNPGVGYTTPPTLTFTDPYPDITATAVANLSAGFVTSITITNPGFGYTVTPTLTIDPAPVSIQASAICSIDGSTGVSTVRVLEVGKNYQLPPTITFETPPDITNVKLGEKYSQNNKTWKWNGSDWQEKITEEFQYFDPLSSNIVKVDGDMISVPITNYEYETILNNSKRKIMILKREYLSLFIDDLRTIMTYESGSEGYINSTLRKTYNPKLTGV